VLDPITIGLAIKAMQGAFHGIQYCCEALSDGKVQVQKIKKAAEDAQAIVKEVKGIWALVRGLFGAAPHKAEPASHTQVNDINVADTTKSITKAKEVFVKHIPTEAEIVEQFIKHVGDFYHHHRELSELYETKSEEVYAMDRPDPRDILLLSQIRHELDGAYMKLSGMMRGMHVPPQLGPLWDNFNKIYENAKDKQAARRERERIRKQQDSWLREEEHLERVELAAAVFLTLLFVLELWAVWINSFTD
jgi:hypothetical protein